MAVATTAKGWGMPSTVIGNVPVLTVAS